MPPRVFSAALRPSRTSSDSRSSQRGFSLIRTNRRGQNPSAEKTRAAPEPHTRRSSDAASPEPSASTVTPRPFVHRGLPEAPRGGEVLTT